MNGWVSCKVSCETVLENVEQDTIILLSDEHFHTLGCINKTKFCYLLKPMVTSPVTTLQVAYYCVCAV